MRNRVAATAVVLIGAIAVVFYFGEQPIVIDHAMLLNADERAFVSEYHTFLADDLDIDYRVVTTSASEPILEESVRLFEQLEIGSESEWSRGLLLVINPRTDEVRLEVGYALEGTFPDGFVSYVEHRQMVPFFSDGRVADGILATTELIVDRAQRHEVSSEEIWFEGSGGGGAQTAARIGAGRDTLSIKRTDDSGGQVGSPEEVLRRYFRAMESRDARPNLTIYSLATQAMLRDRLVTPAQMDGIVRVYRDCTPEPPKYNASGRFSVIRYPPDSRQCSPWFFVKSDLAWTLDLASMGRAIRFGRTNAWHRSARGFGDYAFAFDDWTFDENGFPQ